MPASKQKKSRYKQVQEILTKLQGSKMPSYQGLGCFWMDLPTFKTASLYGQRLIAPAENEASEPSIKSCCGETPKVASPPVETAKNCCGSSEDTTSTAALNKNANLTTGNPPKTGTDKQNCWPSGGSGHGGGSNPSQKRSQTSAIIIGLKGEYPFDGSIYPRLLWDTDNVATAEDIQIIANWIDAGCPADEKEEQANSHHIARVEKSNTRIALANGEALHKISTQKTNQDTTDNKGLTVRKEISNLSKHELATLRSAIDCMYQYNDNWQDERSFDFWARIHTNSCQHGWEQFGPWHRLYLYFFEQTLQDFDSSIALPYWSWTDYSNENTSNTNQLDIGIIPDAYCCYINAPGVEKLKNTKNSQGKSLFNQKEIASLSKLAKAGTYYNSGLRFLNAANIEYTVVKQGGIAVRGDKVNAIYKILLEINPLWFANRWPGSMGSPLSYPTKENIDTLLSLDNWNDFGGGPAYDHHFGSLEKVHNGMHLFAGGSNPSFPWQASAGRKANTEWINKYEKAELTIPANSQNLENPVAGWMTDNRTTAFDPIFWGHHSNVDRIWARWQEKHTGHPQQMNVALAPWSMTAEDTKSTQALGYIYQRDSIFFKTSADKGLVNFKTEAAKVSTRTLDNHRKVEIKLHRMRRGNLPNACIRVFLNTPDANIDTPMENNEHFVEEIRTFHGTCYGGPGHCDLPLDNTRRFDHRPLHHHEPRNYKIDATKIVQNLLNKGETDLTIQMVIVGMDGHHIDNAVFIDGVSLNFID